MSKADEAPKPMDPTAREVSTGVAASNNQRACYAIKTLVKEVLDLFPETPVEYSNYDGRNTALAVTFDLTKFEGEEAVDLEALITLLGDKAYNVDPRIESIDRDTTHEGVVEAMIVTMKSNSRTQDSREPFGLAEAWEVLTEGDSDDSGTWGGWDGHGGVGATYMHTPVDTLGGSS